MRTKDPHPNPGSILLFFRHHEGQTQDQIAQKVGLTKTDISRFERGLNMPVWKARAIADHMGIRINDLVRNNYAALLPKLAYLPVRDPAVQERRRACQLRKLDIGDMGEHFVVECERRKLAGTPYVNGVNGGCADDCGAGYDIFSFTPDGRPKFIESKTTTGDLEEPFFISNGELSFAEYCIDHNLCYELHRVYHLRSEMEAEVRIYSARELLMSFKFEVNDYLATRRESV